MHINIVTKSHENEYESKGKKHSDNPVIKIEYIRELNKLSILNALEKL
jgi:hypothetical protein